MKLSYYNFFYPLENSEKFIAFNSLSGSLATITKEEYETILDFQKHGSTINNSELRDNLIDGQYLVDDDIDELKNIKYSMFKNRYNSEVLGLTIVPTSDCNFRCTYCYEKGVIKEYYMPLNIQESIVELVKLKRNTIQTLQVTWFGGEPLLAIDVIESISDKIIQICAESNINYSASIITNGFMINDEILTKLKKYKIVNMQITLDGTATIHNERRPYKDGSPTFDKILNNLVTYQDLLPATQIRINIDKTNYNSYIEIIELLNTKGVLNKINLNVSPVRNANDNYTNEVCLDISQFSKINLEFQSYLNKKEFFLNSYPKAKSHYCMADSDNVFLIDSDGEVYKCWSDTGIKVKSIGNISDSEFLEKSSENKTVLDYILYDPTVDITCSSCKYLPLCLGGCPNKRIDNIKECTYYKYSLEQILKNIVYCI